MSTQAVRARLGTHPDLADALLREAVAGAKLELEGGAVRRVGWRPALSPAEAASRDAIRDALVQAGREPPSVSELAAVHGAVTSTLLRLIERDGEVVQVEPDRYYSRAALAELMGTLARVMVPERVYGPSELREVLGVSRKFLIPLLEYADRARVTDRRAEGRVIRGT